MGSQASKIPLQPVQEHFSEKSVVAKERDVAQTVARIASSSGNAFAALSATQLQEWEADFENTATLKLAQLMINAEDPVKAVLSRGALIEDQQIFNLELKGIKTDKAKGVYPGPITNQKQSGRCWLFATTNCLRYRIVSHLNLEVNNFQLSQSYLFFYDKLEKSNYYLEQIIDTAEEPLDSRTIGWLNETLIGDGGQWDMAVNLLEKYGCVPQILYPESFSSSSSAQMNSILKNKLREFACELRDLSESLAVKRFSNEKALASLRARKDEQMKQIYATLCVCLGSPPKPNQELIYEYYDKDGKACLLHTSPVDFYKKYTGPFLAEDCFSLINDPRNSYDELYTVARLGNVWQGRPISYVNAEISALEQAVITMIKADQPVFFGCDVGAYLARDQGVMDLKAYDYDMAFGYKFGMTKSQRLEMGQSAMTHAMVITAVHVDASGQPVRYKIENSWSDTSGQKGWYMCTGKWFKEFVYQVVIPKKLAPQSYVKILEGGNATVLPSWDPMGALA